MTTTFVHVPSILCLMCPDDWQQIVVLKKVTTCCIAAQQHNRHTKVSVRVRFYGPLDTRRVISETFFSWLLLKKLILHNKEKCSSGPQIYYNTKKLKPYLVASYDLQPASIVGLQSNPVKWITQEPNYEYPLRQSIHISMFYIIHFV